MKRVQNAKDQLLSTQVFLIALVQTRQETMMTRQEPKTATPIFIGRWAPKILFSLKEKPYRRGVRIPGCLTQPFGSAWLANGSIALWITYIARGYFPRQALLPSTKDKVFEKTLKLSKTRLPTIRDLSGRALQLKETHVKQAHSGWRPPAVLALMHLVKRKLPKRSEMPDYSRCCMGII